MDSDSRVLIAGANGMVGSAIVRNLESKGYAGIIKGTRQVVDFTDQEATDTFFRIHRPEYVFVSAAKVGGIMANNNYKADFLTENLRIQTNIIESANRWNVTKLLFLGSSCIYPKFATQPITEEQLMTGALEPTNDAYAIAKISGIMMCQAYRQQYGFNAISLMPTNLYGPNDNFDLETSHVLPALIRKFYEAKETNSPYVECWGDGSAMREFLHVDDLAEACYRCMISYDSSEIINIGTGQDLTIKELTELISIIIVNVFTL
jgi:GDP-L-fucose synthase